MKLFWYKNAMLLMIYIFARALTNDHIISQNIITMIYAWCVILFRLISLYSITSLKNIIQANILSMTTSYFAVDTILCIFDRNNWIYIIHHVIALSLCIFTDINVIPMDMIGHYLYYIELSNSFLSLRYITYKHKSLKNFITILMVITYIPIRGLLIPWQTWNLLHHALSIYDASPYVSVYLCFCYCGLQIMSWIICLYLYKKLKKIIIEMKDNNDNAWICRVNKSIGTIIYDLDDRLFPIITYISKLYITHYLFIEVLPYCSRSLWYPIFLYCISDMIHVLISFVFYLSNYAPWAERLDNISIHTKITIMGSLAFCISGHRWNIAHMYHLSLYGYVILANARLYNPENSIRTHKIYYSTMYILNFVMSAYPFIMYYPSLLSYIGIITYLFGGLLWAIGIPKNLFDPPRCIPTLFNSLGWMHICVTIADWCMCNQFLYFTAVA